jgi:putative transposase
MAANNTYTQLYIHFVFAVKYRAALLHDDWDGRLRLYISAIVQNNGHKMIAINNMPDHMHLTIGKFQWQNGYGAFSHNRSDVDKVVKYIINQREHHQKKSFLVEYRQLLKRFDIPYDDQYIFKLPE